MPEIRTVFEMLFFFLTQFVVKFFFHKKQIILVHLRTAFLAFQL